MCVIACATAAFCEPNVSLHTPHPYETSLAFARIAFGLLLFFAAFFIVLLLLMQLSLELARTRDELRKVVQSVAMELEENTKARE